MKSERIDGFRIFVETDYRGQTKKMVFVDHVPVLQFRVENVNERKLAAVDMYERCNCSLETAGKICGFHRNTVSKFVRIKQVFGVEALFVENRGSKAPYKYVEEIQLHVESLQTKHPEWTDQMIADRATRDLEINVSRCAVARIRTSDIQSKKERLIKNQDLIDLHKAADKIERELYDGKQLQLNFQWDEELKKKCDEFITEAAPEPKKETEKQLVERLQEGERFSVAGNLMLQMFLNEIKIQELASMYPFIPGSTYQSIDLFLTLFHSINLQIPSIEALKLVNASEYGVFLGINRIPEKETIRNHLELMAEQYVSSDIIDEFARQLLHLNFIDPEVFFIDGHFLPYYGLNVIAKGYYTVRRMAMKGNELYAVTDLQGRPLFFITETNEIDFRPMIIRSVEKIISYGIERPLMVFDRGGYGIHFFNQLSEKADFVTWAKYLDETKLNNMQESSFNACFCLGGKKYMVADEEKFVSESPQTAAKDGRSERATAKLRLVILENLSSGKRIGIYTNNWDKPAYTIALYMLQRWGDSENFFKEMKARFNLDYHPGYDIKELENQPLVDNPDLDLIRKAIRILKKEIQELDREILMTEGKLNRRKDKRLDKKLSELPVLIEEKQEEIKNFEKRVETLPDKVSMIDLLKGKPVSRCDLEKKRIYDTIQFMSFLARERLLEIFKQCYEDDRDVKKVLDMITSRSGYVKLVGRTLVVLLDWIENEKHRLAAEQLCHKLNRIGVLFAGRLNVDLFFRISKFPHHGKR